MNRRGPRRLRAQKHPLPEERGECFFIYRYFDSFSPHFPMRS